ncbi:uncharacterized protein LOC135088214 [Ostrinia nubilalis]|uniref:uncharacterized protein LOC135074062 n=1 Tax=Ostrinia nubilalis TaxID=29057 RepID=UPI0030826656
MTMTFVCLSSLLLVLCFVQQRCFVVFLQRKLYCLIEINMENEKNKKKRQRSENWLEEDKNILMDLVRERVSIIENKNTDTNTNSKKLAAWADLLTSFNSMCTGGVRSLPQLKSQWSIIKMTKKKAKSEERKKLLQTGGGPPPPTNPANADDICSWLPNEFVIDINEFDSDCINQINVGKTLDKKDNVEEIKKKDIIASHSIIHKIPDEISDIGPESEVIDVAQEPLHEIQNTPKFISIGSPKIKATPSRMKSNKQEKVNKVSTAAATVVAVDTECRKQLHEVVLANEQRKTRNLDLEESLLQLKMEYYRKKIKLLENKEDSKE